MMLFIFRHFSAIILYFALAYLKISALFSAVICDDCLVGFFYTYERRCLEFAAILKV